MVKLAVKFWWKMLLTIFPAKEARKSPSKLRRKFATNFAENFANFTLEIAGAYDLRVAIRIANRNRSQIARFGALSFGVLMSAAEVSQLHNTTPPPP